jgi:hypothetical protein
LINFQNTDDFSGNSPQLFLSDTYGDEERKWADEFGLVYRLAGGLGVRIRFYIPDYFCLMKLSFRVND